MSRSKSTGKRPTATARTKKTSGTPKSAVPAEQTYVCREPGCGKACKSKGGLTSHTRQAHQPAAPPPEPESPTAAVARALAVMTLTAAQSVLAANVRELAVALEACEPTDKAKTAKELRAQWAELVGAAGGDRPAGADWTDADDG
jgi:hypothetical protein